MSSPCATKSLISTEIKNDHDTDEHSEDRMIPLRFLFALGGVLLLTAASAFAGPKEDVAAATTKWGETLGQDDPDKVLALPTRSSGEHYRQRCGQIERRSVTISLARLRSCLVSKCRSESN